MKDYEVNGMCIDLEYIVSIGQVEETGYLGASEFTIHTIVGKEIKVKFNRPTTPPEFFTREERQEWDRDPGNYTEYYTGFKKMTEERRKLIEAWRDADFSIVEEIARMLGRKTTT